MKRIDYSVSKAQRDVWAWKEAIYQEVRDMPVPAALSAILDKASAVQGKRRRVAAARRRPPQ
ncbi:MAG: hypothetical protein ACP5I8_13355 [Phycisphaerae bacterium]